MQQNLQGHLCHPSKFPFTRMQAEAVTIQSLWIGIVEICLEFSFVQTTDCRATCKLSAAIMALCDTQAIKQDGLYLKEVKCVTKARDTSQLPRMSTPKGFCSTQSPIFNKPMLNNASYFRCQLDTGKVVLQYMEIG